MSHADRFANAERLLSSVGDVAVAAFAVCVQKNPESLVGNQLISYIEDGVKINTKSVTDVAAWIGEKMNQNQ